VSSESMDAAPGCALPLLLGDLLAAVGSSWPPPGVDPDRSSAARIYDFLLGGSHNFAADRAAAQALIVADPRVPEYARVNREFLARAVQFIAAAGVDQFIDLGSGIPTRGSVHAVARQVVGDVRVVYVDVDPVAAASGRQVLSGDERAAMVRADVRDPESVLTLPAVRELVDLSRPVGVLMVAVLHFVADPEGPAGIVATFREAVASGSYLVISHAAPGPEHAGAAAEALRTYRATGTPLTLRSREQIEALFAGWRPVSPGVVEVGRWRPSSDGEPCGRVPGLAGVAVKP
jgi:SAM-dependent methyltransferase